MSQSLGRGDLPPVDGGLQRPLVGWPDWWDPETAQVVVNRSGNRAKGGKRVHVPDPVSDSPAPVCAPAHATKGFRVVEAAVYPDRTYCANCPWGEVDGDE